MKGRWIADFAWLGGEDLFTEVLIEHTDGVFDRIEPGQSADTNTPRLHGIVMPGLVNAHSHAFHRSLRGRTHRQGGDFWLWRERMYEVAANLHPDSYEELAASVFTEMAMSGITTVGEFHYLHHQSNGVPYADPNEMGHALVRAARAAGIRISLLDTGYLRAGFGDEALNPVQERFSDGSVDAWLDRVEHLIAFHEEDDMVRVGVAPHSVRAVPSESFAPMMARIPDFLPIHIHVSEQPAENRDCLEATGLTPVGLLARHQVLGQRTTAVHATHLTSNDIDTLGSSSTGVCLCATTERDLADGLGPASSLRDAGSNLSVGSDSHAVIDLFEEARGIELHNRLRTGRRGVFAPSSLLAAATVAGADALGFGDTGLQKGAPADFIVLDSSSHRMTGVTADEGAAHLVFSATSADVSDVFVAGSPVVRSRIHFNSG